MERDVRGESIDLAHHYVEGDGLHALENFLEGFEAKATGQTVTRTQYDNLRLQVKTLILRESPPDLWSAWPGANLREYVDAGVAGDITDVWAETDVEASYRDVAVDVAKFDGRVHAVPLAVHRFNDLYVHLDRAEELGVDLDAVSDAESFATHLEEVAAETGEPPLLFPMANPWTALQLWEVVLLGQYDPRTFEALTAGDARAHREAIHASLEVLDRLAEVSPDDSLYQTLTDANERFVDGAVPLYPQGDWAGGAFNERAGVKYGSDWDRVAFPGTDQLYGVVMDALIPSANADIETIRPLLEYAGSTDGQERFNATKGSVPTRADVDLGSFTEFGKDQARALDRSRDQPLSITHGLGASPGQLIDLKSAMATFIEARDTDRSASMIIDSLS